jgi:hypothetical protein
MAASLLENSLEQQTAHNVTKSLTQTTSGFPCAALSLDWPDPGRPLDGWPALDMLTSERTVACPHHSGQHHSFRGLWPAISLI